MEILFGGAVQRNIGFSFSFEKSFEIAFVLRKQGFCQGEQGQIEQKEEDQRREEQPEAEPFALKKIPQQLHKGGRKEGAGTGEQYGTQKGEGEAGAFP